MRVIADSGETNTHPHKDLHTNAHSSFIHHGPKLGSAQVSTCRRTSGGNLLLLGRDLALELTVTCQRGTAGDSQKCYGR